MQIYILHSIWIRTEEKNIRLSTYSIHFCGIADTHVCGCMDELVRLFCIRVYSFH